MRLISSSSATTVLVEAVAEEGLAGVVAVLLVVLGGEDAGGALEDGEARDVDGVVVQVRRGLVPLDGLHLRDHGDVVVQGRVSIVAVILQVSVPARMQQFARERRDHGRPPRTRVFFVGHDKDAARRAGHVDGDGFCDVGGLGAVREAAAELVSSAHFDRVELSVGEEAVDDVRGDGVEPRTHGEVAGVQHVLRDGRRRRAARQAQRAQRLVRR
mmetsp:Transcript_25809/g.79395  ORF Transcript_25809/g.79395 Transcript_25809/m.79395 type:complete len:214 (-) Transcript_25809:307-948(-)